MRARFITAAIFAALAGGILACATDRGPMEPTGLVQGHAAKDLLGIDLTTTLSTATQTATLLYCDPRPAAVTRQKVGPAGGVISAGLHQLSIPAGALSKQVTITMTAPSDTAATVQFEPEGLQFRRGYPATLTMSLSGCATPPVKNVSILYIDDIFTVLERLLSKWNGNHSTLTAELQHFSRYAVAW